MSDAFDPYYKWLGILPKDQPPHHYRLLGLEPFEDDLQVIEAAADRQITFLRKFQSGEHAAECQKLLNEVSRARLCLLKADSKEAYDGELRASLESPSFAAPPSFAVEQETSPTKPTRRGTGWPIPAVACGVLILIAVGVFVAVRGGGKKVQNAADADSLRLKNSKLTDGKNANIDQPSKAPTDFTNGPVDLLPLLASENILKGRWKIEPHHLESVLAEPLSQLALPVKAPEEYTLHLEATRFDPPDSTAGTIGFGLTNGQFDCLFAMGNYSGGRSGIQMLDGRGWEHNETSLYFNSSKAEIPFQLDAIVRRGNVEVRVDGRTIVDWSGDFSRFRRDSAWNLAEPHQLFLIAESKYEVTKLTLGPPLPRHKVPGGDLKVGETEELLKYVDITRDVWQGAWLKDGLSLKCSPSIPFSRFSVPFEIPDEYELIADIETEQPGREFCLGIPFQKGYATMGLGGDTGQTAILVPEQGTRELPGLFRRGPVFETERSKVTVTVRKNHLVVRIGDRTIFDWRGDPQQFRAVAGWATPGYRVMVGSYGYAYRIHSLKLKRLAESPSPFSKPASPENGDLLSIVDVDRDTTMGQWSKADGILKGSGIAVSGLRFPATLPANYEFRVIAERKSGEHNFSLSLPVSETSAMLAIDGANGTVSGIEWVEGRRMHENSMTVRHNGHKFPIGKPGVILGRVEGRHIHIDFNGEKLLDVDLPRDHFDQSWDMRPGWLSPEERLQLAVATWYAAFEIREVRFRSLDKSTPEKSSPAFPPVDLAAITKPPSNKPMPLVATSPTKPTATGAPDPGTSSVGEGLLATGSTPVPEVSAQEAALKKIREVFAAEYAKAKKDPEKLALAIKLEKLADDAREDLATKYVAFEEARKLAIEVGDLTQAISIVDSLALEFKLDPTELRIGTLKGIASKLKGPLLNQSFTEAVLPIIDQLIQSERYPQAAELATLAGQSALKAKDKALQSDTQDIRREAQTLADEFEVANKARETLKASPEDPAARLAWGRWLCLRRNQWAEGLAVLQGTNDPALKDLAARDLRGPVETEYVQLGTDWLAYSKSAKDRTKAEYVERAQYWLGKGHVLAKGLEKTRIELSLQEAFKIREGNSPLGALLNLVDQKVVQHKYIQSEESRRDGGEAFEEVSAHHGILIGFNYAIGGHYEYNVIRAIQPIYATNLGTQVGQWYGSFDGPVLEVRARPGYAVNSIRCTTGGAFDYFQVAFSRITKSGLDPKRSYQSPIINSKNPRAEFQTQLPPTNQAVIGIFGHVDGHLRGLGLIIAR